MRKFRVFLLVALGILVWVVVFAGCSGSNSLTVTLAPASGQSLNPGQTVTITATVANDNTNGGVTWTLSGPGHVEWKHENHSCLHSPDQSLSHLNRDHHCHIGGQQHHNRDRIDYGERGADHHYHLASGGNPERSL